jgi:hypothetical protein
MQGLPLNPEMFSTGNILASVLFSLIGMFAFRAAKRDSNLMALLCSMGLLGYSWFVTNVWANWGCGIVLSYFTIRALKNG